MKEHWIVDPDKKAVFVYHYGKENFRVSNYFFMDKITAGIYEDLVIDFAEIDEIL